MNILCPLRNFHIKEESITYSGISTIIGLNCKCTCGCEFTWIDMFHWRIINE